MISMRREAYTLVPNVFHIRSLIPKELHNFQDLAFTKKKKKKQKTKMHSRQVTEEGNGEEEENKKRNERLSTHDPFHSRGVIFYRNMHAHRRAPYTHTYSGGNHVVRA